MLYLCMLLTGCFIGRMFFFNLKPSSTMIGARYSPSELRPYLLFKLNGQGTPYDGQEMLSALVHLFRREQIRVTCPSIYKPKNLVLVRGDCTSSIHGTPNSVLQKMSTCWMFFQRHPGGISTLRFLHVASFSWQRPDQMQALADNVNTLSADMLLRTSFLCNTSFEKVHRTSQTS